MQSKFRPNFTRSLYMQLRNRLHFKLFFGAALPFMLVLPVHASDSGEVAVPFISFFGGISTTLAAVFGYWAKKEEVPWSRYGYWLFCVLTGLPGIAATLLYAVITIELGLLSFAVMFLLPLVVGAFVGLGLMWMLKFLRVTLRTLAGVSER